MSAKIDRGVPMPVAPDDERLKALFDELRKNQITFLDETGKRVIEISTGMIGVLFAVTAFGKDFPPHYLVDFYNKRLAIVSLCLFFLSLLSGFIAIQPREYKDYFQNLTGMEEQIQKLIGFKIFWFRLGGGLFIIGIACLAYLLYRIIA
jgi:hypothetical protein